MVMKNGNVLKERWEYYKEVFTTRDGLISFFVVGAIWSFLIVNYTDQIFVKIKEYMTFMPAGPLQNYAGYLVFNLIIALTWWTILWIVINIINKVLGGKNGQSFRGQ